MQKWNDTQEGVKFTIKCDQSYEVSREFGKSLVRVTKGCVVRRKSPIAAVAQDFIPREENQERREHLVYYLIFLPTLEEGHAIGVRGMLNS